MGKRLNLQHSSQPNLKRQKQLVIKKILEVFVVQTYQIPQMMFEASFNSTSWHLSNDDFLLMIEAFQF